MADLYIEQANSAFQQLWVGGGQVAVSSPQVADTLNAMQRQLQQCLHHVQLLQGRTSSQDETIDKLREENAKLTHAVASISKRVEFLEGDQGFVTKPEALHMVRSLPELEAIPALREQCLTLHQRLQETSLEWKEQLKASIHQLHDSLTRTTSDELRAVRGTMTKMGDDHQVSLQQASSAISKLTHMVHDAQSQLAKDMKDAHFVAEQHARTALETSRMELEASMSQVIAHLKHQAVAVDGLSAAVEKHRSGGPTLQQLEQVREEMRSTRDDMDRAQFRIHEAYSQLMSLTKAAATTGMRLDLGVGVPAKDVQERARLDRPSASRARDDSPSKTSPHTNATMSSTVLSDAIDAAVEPLRRELSKLQTVAIPSLASAVGIQRETVDNLLAAHQRALGTLTSLFACLGLRDRFDEMLASIEVMDAGHVALMIRKALETVVPHLVGAASLARGSGTVSPSNSALLAAPTLSPIPVAAAVDHSSIQSTGKTPATAHTPLHYARRNPASGSQTLSQPFSLGVDVTDAAEGAEGTAGLGAKIMHVVEGSVAEAYGLVAGEIVRKVNRESVQGASHFARLMRQAERSSLSQWSADHQAAPPPITLTVLKLSKGSVNGLTKVVDIPLQR